MRNHQLKAFLSVLLSVIILVTGFFVVITLVSVARAQVPELPPPALWFASTAAWGVVTSWIVSTLRANVFKSLKGVGAIVFTLAFSVAGAIVASTGILASAGISLDANLLEAVIFGLTAGAIALGWYDGTAAIAGVVGKTIAQANTATLALVASTAASNPAQASANLSPETVIDFIFSLVKSRFGGLDKVPPFVWGVVQTLVTEFAGQALTPDVRRAVQRRLLDLLAAAGAPGKDVS